MSFPSSSGVLTLEEFEVVRGVYAAIAGEDWFTRSPDRRKQFAATVIDLYRQGCDTRVTWPYSAVLSR